MSDGTHISWADATWNPVTGCTKVSAGCDHCYIDRTAPFRMQHRKFDQPGLGGTTGVLLHPDRLEQPLRWRKPRRVFVNSLSDLFHADVPDDFLVRAFDTMHNAPQHVFQVLTKRPARMRSFLTRYVAGLFGGPAPQALGQLGRNIWLGVSAEDQKTAGQRIPLLLGTPAAIRWISAEPLLGPIDLSDCAGVSTLEPDWVGGPTAGSGAPHPLLDWVVAGGESGPAARPAHPDWLRSLRNQCAAAGVPFHFKQWGEWGPAPWSVRVCDPAIGWQGTDEELSEAKADAEARGATHAYASWAHEHGWDLYEPSHKPWSLERQPGPLTGGQAAMRRWGKRVAGRELDGVVHDAYPATRSAVSA